jgi:biotin transporter BioY
VKVNKRLREQYEEFIYRGQNVPFSLGTLVVVMLCVLLLMVGTFTQLTLSHQWLDFGADEFLKLATVNYPYIPQVPIILFIAVLLGARFGLLTLVLYIIIGFFVWPVFAFGGGISYVKNPMFGFILGYVPAVILAGAILHKENSLKSLAIASFFGVLIIHISGLIYIGVLSIFQMANFTFAIGNIIQLGGAKILYDWILSFIAMCFAYPVKCVLWLAMKNSAKQPKQSEAGQPQP